MARPRKRANELLMRSGTIATWDASLTVRIDRPRGESAVRECSRHLTFEGELTEAMRDVTAFSLMLHVSDDHGSVTGAGLGVGAIISIKPRIQAAAGMRAGEMHELLTLAACGRLKSVCLVFPEPLRGKAPIVTLEFSTRLDDD